MSDMLCLKAYKAASVDGRPKMEENNTLKLLSVYRQISKAEPATYSCKVISEYHFLPTSPCLEKTSNTAFQLALGSIGSFLLFAVFPYGLVSELLSEIQYYRQLVFHSHSELSVVAKCSVVQLPVDIRFRKSQFLSCFWKWYTVRPVQMQATSCLPFSHAQPLLWLLTTFCLLSNIYCCMCRVIVLVWAPGNKQQTRGLLI